MTDFAAVEALLNELVSIVSPSDYVKAHVHEYIDADEYGLALEWVGIGMFDNGRSASPSEIALFRKIAAAMSDDSDWHLNQARSGASLPKSPLPNFPWADET
jgi:hypothetical protein